MYPRLLNDIDLEWWRSEEDYGHLDEGIRVLVQALHAFKIRTVACCEGRIRESSIYVGVLPYPWVIIFVDPTDLARIRRTLSRWNREHPDKRWILSQERVHGSYTREYIRSTITKGNPDLLVTALVPECDNERELSTGLLASLQGQVPELAALMRP